MLSRIKQGLTCLFSKYDKKNDEEVKKILTMEEFEIFDKMEDYDKVHSFNIFLQVKRNEELSREILYLKLALLHDCGKDKVTIFRRIKKVIFGDKKLEAHPSLGEEKLKEINSSLGYLIGQHHNKTVDKKMEIFQKIDDM